MCGIVGFVSYKKEESLIRELTDSIAHRGPDESDFTIFQKDNYYVHFGSSRLSIVGEKAGKMPMNDVSGNLLVYNGELYDLQKTRLKINKNLATTSDTVHLFEYLKQNSNKNLSDLNGMFAFSFYDSKDNSVLLSRDKLGIKPPVMTPELEESLCNLFMEIQKPYSKHCPDSRVNFLNYYYVSQRNKHSF